ncbi:MAG: TolC family protein [Gammaproteobacteria bacterium]|jgi:outer membrane protein|nr:TolC family protein [Gammaproteobacteria bacterium]MBT3861129.1 TolC family protein [Gammaproteobacteria bacterium]MBT3987661.1 TolC family protein [Gammaproteobacteria bacterium]MBT4255215.1 TolC family protein [Gammaproteobacteria bacterium]MBT4581242.1 TolC family protein [Gammaproteobacteria bacterium]
MKNTSVLAVIWLTLIGGWSSALLAADDSGRRPSSPMAGSTLEDFFSAAINYSPQLKIAEERLNIGSARTSAAKGQLLPQLRANASRSDNRRNALGSLQTFDGERYSITLTQVLFNWQAFSARKEASLIEDQFEAEYYGELGLLLTDVAEKYFDVLLANDALSSIATELDAVSNQLDQIQSMYDRQLAQVTDLYQAQAGLAAVEAQQLQLQTELAVRREALRSASGVESGELYRLSDDANIPPLENSINYWVQQAEDNNHQVRAREYAVEAADKRIDQRRGAYMPQVNFIVQRQDSDVGFDNIPQARTDNTYIGLDITIPLYAGGSNRAGVREATSQLRIAESELRQVQLEASERVRSAYLQVQSAETLIAAAQKLVESTTLSSTAMQRGFELGAVTSVDVLNALRDQFRSERDLQATRYNHVKYLLLLKRETGLLSADDMLEVGSWLESPGL